jgi:hypothetical protein
MNDNDELGTWITLIIVAIVGFLFVLGAAGGLWFIIGKAVSFFSHI